MNLPKIIGVNCRCKYSFYWLWVFYAFQSLETKSYTSVWIYRYAGSIKEDRYLFTVMHFNGNPWHRNLLEFQSVLILNLIFIYSNGVVAQFVVTDGGITRVFPKR